MFKLTLCLCLHFSNVNFQSLRDVYICTCWYHVIWMTLNLYFSEILPVCEFSQLSNFSLKLVQSRNQVWSSRFCWQQGLLRNNRFGSQFIETRCLFKTDSHSKKKIKLPKHTFYLHLRRWHLWGKSLRNVVDSVWNEVALTFRISRVLKLSSSCPWSNMQRHCRQVFWPARVTPNCPSLNHLQPFF